ncbi:MAG: hypothetical protein RLZZ399_1177 [Verrucomicrobiota bacterium]|jgi:hypothetical protein
MARRARSAFPLGKTLAGLGGFVALMVGGYLTLGKGDSFRTTSPFPIKDYLENANSLRGNTYRLEAMVDKTLEFSRESGRLFSIEAAGGDMLPLLVPPALSGTNIERGQKLVFKVQVSESGLVTASEVRKP